MARAEEWDELSERVENFRAALQAIAEKANWYANNGDRDPHEVDHALCVEILSLAEEALS